MAISPKTIKMIDHWVRLLDTKFGVGWLSVGIDPLFDLIPGIGGFIPSIFTLYLIILSIQVEAPTKITAQLVSYLLIDFLIGAVPLLGIPFDALYHANAKSWKLLRPHVVERDIQL